jgi:predicted site-specific integrase-resolvase
MCKEKMCKEKMCKEKKCEDVDQLDQIDKIKGKLSICYVRVSSQGQKEDLERQKAMMKEKYPTHIIIEDIGSGLNLNKRGIKKIIHLAIEGKIKEVVVAYRDRLTRFGYELIEELVSKYSEGEIKVLNEKELIEPEEEIVKDMMSIMNVYVAKMNGLRKYRKKINEI